MKYLMSLLVAFFGCLLIAEERLLPVVDEAYWKMNRTASAVAELSIEEQDGQKVMHVRQNSDEGYCMYRTHVTLPAGEYTLRVGAKGKTDKGLFIQCYTFDSKNKPTPIILHQTEGGVLEPDDIYVQFRVPSDSKTLRMDLGLAGSKGDVYYWNPNVLKGKVNPPPKKKVGFTAIPAANDWLAHWIWFENDKGVPGMLFEKKFTLENTPVNALCEITADNGYELQLNGKFVGADVDWKSVEVYDLMPYLQVGENTINIHVKNTDGPAGLLFQAVILDEKGKDTAVITDGSWKVTHRDGKPAAIKDFGAGSAKTVWGKIPFHKINPPKTLQLKVVNAVRNVKAGELLHFEFPLPKELDVKPEIPFPGLDIDYIDVVTGKKIALSGIPVFSRCVYGGQRKQLFVEHMTSVFANPGTYRVEITGKDFVIHAGEVTVAPADKIPEGCGVRMPKPSLKNYFENNDMKQSLYVFAPHIPSLERFTSWEHTGGHFYELSVSTGTWSRDMMYDMAEIEKRVLIILELDPLATITLKFRIDVPGWWVNAHPNDVYQSKQGRSAQQSFCSDIWREDSIKTVINSMEWLDKRPAGKAISGALLMGFRGGEFQLWGEDVGERDCSAIARKCFDEYQKKNNIKPHVDIEDAALDYPWKLDGKQSTAHARDVFFRFVAKRQAENLIYFSNKFKEHFGDKYTFAFYFGYGMEYCGSHSRMLLAGHLGIEDVYEKGTFDMESCPLSYGFRRLERSHAFMYPVDSARLHGILPIGENDVRNCLNPDYADSSGVSIHSMRKTIMDNTRIRYFEAAHGALVRYLALHEHVNWYDHPALWRSIRDDDKMVMELTANEIGGDDQLAMAVNFMELTRAWRLPEDVVGRFNCWSRDYLMRTGYGVDFITLRDLIEQKVTWKQAFIPLPGLLTAAQKQGLAKKFGKPLPTFKEDDGALIWKNGNWSVLPSTANAQDIWRALAKPEAIKAGYDTIWYKGGNFLRKYDSKNQIFK